MIVVTLAVSGSTFVLAQASRQAELEFKAAQHKQDVEGDLKGAIVAYEKIARGKDRALAAKAYLQIAECYRLMNDVNARKYYERVLTYTDQPQLMALAREGLSSLGDPRLASPKPANLAMGNIRRDWRVTSGGNIIGIDTLTGDVVTVERETGRITRLVAGRRTDSDLRRNASMYESPVLSPDLRSVAYTWRTPTNGGALNVTAVDGQAEARTLLKSDEQLVEPHALAWSADGRALLISVGRRNGSAVPEHWELAWLSVANGSLTTIHRLDTWRVEDSADDMALSPDGRFIAFAVRSERGRPSQSIFVIPVEGGAETEIAAARVATGSDANPRWTSDGSHLLFASTSTASSKILSVAMRNGRATGAPQTLRTEPGVVTLNGLTATGRLFYTVSADASTITVVDMASLGNHIAGTAMHVSERFAGRGPSWSRDGRFMAFKRPKADGAGFDLVVRDAATGRELTYSPSSLTMGDGKPQWRGASMLQPMADQRFLVTVEPNGLSETQSAHIMPLGPASTDWKTVYSMSSRRLIASEVATGTARELNVPPGSLSMLDVSPDGRFIAGVQVAGVIGEMRLVRAALDGSGNVVTRQRPLHDARALTWVRDGRSVLVAEPAGGSLWRILRVDPTSEQEAEFTGIEVSAQRVTGMSLNADGTRLAIGSRDVGNDVWTVDLPWSAKP
jgi:hypothetical protein